MQWWSSCLIHRWFIIVLLHGPLFPDVAGGTSPSVVTVSEVVTEVGFYEGSAGHCSKLPWWVRWPGPLDPFDLEVESIVVYLEQVEVYLRPKRLNQRSGFWSS